MRQILAIVIAAGLSVLTGCPQEAGPGNLTTVAGISESVDAATGDATSGGSVIAAPSSSRDSADNPPTRTPDAPPLRLTLSDSVGGSGDFAIFALDSGLVGDAWTATTSGPLTNTNLILALFDAQNNLIRRDVVAPGGALIHQLRAPSDVIRLAVAPAVGSPGGSFTILVERTAGIAPAARPQVVWLNFAGGSNVRIHGRAPIAFGAFDAGRLGDAYAGASAQFRQIIVSEMRDDYAPYNITILSSDDGPPPAATHAVLHFGGDDNRLLGLADSVDQYNTNLGEAAIIYTDAFAAFAVMQLSVEEMAQMIANTGSHELGHLLGLFHTKAPAHIMDTTGTAWDLVADQRFGVGALEPSVFPTGFEDASALLLQTLGPNPNPQSGKSLSTAKWVQRARIRAMMDEALPARCGTCLDPDH